MIFNIKTNYGNKQTRKFKTKLMKSNFQLLFARAKNN